MGGAGMNIWSVFVTGLWKENLVDLGVLSAGDLGYSCGTGMYGGTIKVVEG